MKERIIIEQDWLVKDMKSGMPEPDKLVVCQKIEQVPETWEELKELCRNSKIPKCYFRQDLFIKTEEPLTYYEHIWVDGVLFLEDGSIYAGYEIDNVSNNRTPAQMWEIINNLIGE